VKGYHLVKPDLFYPSTKRCSSSGKVKEKMPLWERIYTCSGCGLVMDRDLNARRNLTISTAGPAESGVATGERGPCPGGQVLLEESGT